MLHAFTGVATIASCITIVPTSCHGTGKLMWHVVINMLINRRLRSKTVHLLLRHSRETAQNMASNTTYDLLHNISISYLKDKLYNLDEIFISLIMKRWRCHRYTIVTKLVQRLLNIPVSSAPLVLDFSWCMVELRTQCCHECMALNECQCLFEARRCMRPLLKCPSGCHCRIKHPADLQQHLCLC